MLAGVVIGAVAQFVRQCVEVKACQEVVHGLGTHLSDELVGVGVVEELVVGVYLRFENVEVLIFGKQVHLVRAVKVFALAILAAF